MSSITIHHPAPVASVPIDGVDVLLGGVIYILPPCSLATLKRHTKGIDAMQRSSFDFSEASVDTILNLVFEALRRNYPDITPEFVAEHLGLDMVMETFQAAMDVSGLMRKSKAAATSKEAAQEGGTLGESTGTASPPTL
ncbi:MAG: hypothetical protein Q8R67_02465 [Rhodoferax sp.]|nr:hypothetical protein [Rhodoferax sp.]MDP3650524.1 hypothetical protein [Rhodoferax sp.]